MNDAIGHAWKILTAAHMETLVKDGIFHGAPVDVADGYIHLSADDQLAGTLDKHFAGQQDLWLAKVDLASLGDAVRWEVSRGNALFPHIYGPLPLGAVTALGPLDRQPDGSIVHPEG